MAVRCVVSVNSKNWRLLQTDDSFFFFSNAFSGQMTSHWQTIWSLAACQGKCWTVCSIFLCLFFVAYCVDIWPVFLFWLHPSCLHDGIGYFIWAFNYLSVINSSKILCSLAFAAWAFWKCQFDCSSKFIIWVCWCFLSLHHSFLPCQIGLH